MPKRVLLVLSFLMSAAPAYGEGFFEIIYSPKVIHGEDLEDLLVEAPSYGVQFGYDTEILEAGVFFDIELGYEVSDHEIDVEDDPDYYYRSHRGFLGIRLKYGGWGYVEPYIGTGVMVYSYYEASDDAADALYSDYEIETNGSGLYTVIGVDFYFAKESSFSLGIEQRTMNFGVVDSETDADVDVEVKRLGVKISAMF